MHDHNEKMILDGIKDIIQFTGEMLVACAATYLIFVLIWWIANLILG